MFDDFDDLSDDDFGFGDNIYTDEEDTELFGGEGSVDVESSYNNFIEDFEEPDINDTGLIDAEIEPVVEEIPVVDDIVDDSELFEEPDYVSDHSKEMKKYENTHEFNSSEENKSSSEQELFISIQMDIEKEDTPEPNDNFDDFAETEHLESSPEENIEECAEATKDGTNYLKSIEHYNHETDSDDNDYEYNYQYDKPKSKKYKNRQKSKKARTYRKINFQHQEIFKIIKGPLVFVATVLLLVFVPLFIEKALNLKTAENKQDTNKSNSSQEQNKDRNNSSFSEKEKEYVDIINSKEFNEFLKKNGYTILDNEASTNANDVKIVSSRFKTISELDDYIKEASSTIYTAAKNNTYSYLEERNKKAKATTNYAKYTTAINEILHLLVTNQSIYSESGNEKIYATRFNNIVGIMTYIDVLNSMVVNNSTFKEIKNMDKKLQNQQ